MGFDLEGGDTAASFWSGPLSSDSLSRLLSTSDAEDCLRFDVVDRGEASSSVVSGSMTADATNLMY